MKHFVMLLTLSIASTSLAAAPRSSVAPHKPARFNPAPVGSPEYGETMARKYADARTKEHQRQLKQSKRLGNLPSSQLKKTPPAVSAVRGL
jgi:hypothetical protein